MSLDAERLGNLARIKLEGLVRRAFPDVTSPAESFNAGVGIAHGDRAFVHLIEDAPSPMAAALAWGARRDASELHVIVDAPDHVLTLQARGLHPSPTVWQAVEIDLRPMVDTGPVTALDVPDVVVAQVPVLEAAGCDVVIEHGLIIGEILGVEVARIAVEVDGRAQVRVGVGLYDQEAHALVHAGAGVAERLDQVVAEVRRHRNAQAGPHPLNRIARERWLRSVVVDDPSLLGLDTLAPEAPLVPRSGIHEQRPVAARGTRGDTQVLVVCSTGIDLDLVPMAAAHIGHDRPDEVVLVLPARDHHEIIGRMAGRLAVPASLTSVPDPWEPAPPA